MARGNGKHNAAKRVQPAWRIRQMRVAVALAVLAGLPASAAFAQTAVNATRTWSPAAGGTYAYDLDSNWTVAGYPSGTAAIANININFTGDQIINLNQAITLDDLVLGDSTLTSSVYNSVTIEPNGGSLTFNGASSLLSSRNGSNVVNANITMLVPLAINKITAAGPLTINGNIDNGANLLTIGAGASGSILTINGIIGNGAGGLTVGGSAGSTFNLNGNNTYQGATQVNTGARVVLGHNSALGTTDNGTTIASGGAIDLNGRNVGLENFSIAGTGVSNSGVLHNGSGTPAVIGGTVTMTGAATIRGSGDITIANLGTGNFVLTKNDGGKLTLTGASGRTGTSADTTITAGTIRVEHANALDSGAATQIVTVANGATLELANSIAFGSTTTLSVGGTLHSVGSNSTTLPVTFANSGQSFLSTANASDVLTLGDGTNDIVAGGTATVVTVVGPGTVSVPNSNAFNGNWRVTAGVLRYGHASALTNTAARTITLEPGAVLSPRASADTTFTANPIILDASTTGTYTIRHDRDTVGDGVTYTHGPLTITANQTLALTTATGGNVNTNTPFGVILGDVTLNGNASFNVGMNGSGIGTLSLGNFTLANAFGITKEGAGTLELTGNASNGYTGVTTVNAGVLALNKTGAVSAISGNVQINGGILRNTGGTNPIADTSNVTLAGGQYQLNSINDTINSLTMSGGSLSAGVATLTLASNTTPLTLSAGVIVNGPLSFSGASLGSVIAFTGTSGTGTLNENVNLGAVVRELNINDGSAAVDMAIQNTITGSGSAGINKTNAGTLRFSGLSGNTYPGLTTVSAGALLFDKGSGTGGVNAVAGNIVVNGSGAVLRLAQNEQIPNASVVTVREGTFDLSTHSETLGTALVLGDAAGVTPLVTIDTGGALKPNAGIQYSGGAGPLAATISGAGSVDLNAGVRTFEVQDSAAVGAGLPELTISSNITGAVGSGLTKTGAGLLLLSGSNDYVGDTTISDGTIRVAGGNGISNNSRVVTANSATALLDLNSTSETIGSLSGGGALGGNVNIGHNATLTIGSDNTSPAPFFGDIVGTGAAQIAKTGSGRLTLSGTSVTYPGITNVNAGDLRINGTLASSASTVEVNGGGATLSGTGTINRHVNINPGGFISPGASTGTLNVDSITWKPLGNYYFEMNNATGTEGSASGWDLLNVAGVLDITATSSNKFTVYVNSLDLSQSPGDAVNFVNSTIYQWRIATASGGITGFSADAFQVNAAGFSNDDAPTQWTITSVGDDIFLNYLGNEAVISAPATFNNVRMIQNQTNQPGNMFITNGINLQTGDYNVTVGTGDVVAFTPSSGTIPGGGSQLTTLGWANTAAVGARSGTIIVAATNGNPNDLDDTVTVNGAVVNDRTLTATPLGTLTVIAGTPIVTNTTISSPVNTNDTLTRVTLPAGSQTSGPLTLGAGSAYQFGGANDAVNSTIRSLSATFATPGVYAGNGTFSPNPEGLVGEVPQDFTIAYDVTAVNRSNGSFDDATDLNDLEIDFGSLYVGSPAATQAFSIHNLPNGSAALTAKLDLQAGDISGIGALGMLFTDLTSISDLAADSSLNFIASFNPTTPGVWQAVYTLNVRDDTAVLGADYNAIAYGTTPLTLTLKGTVLVPEPATFSLLVLGGTLLLRRNRRR